MRSQVLDLTRELIARPSISPRDEGCQELMADRLKAIGFTVEHMPFEDVSNLWAWRGEAKPRLVFAGHTDVVPVGSLESWQSDPFEPTLREGYLYGRGAADMKSSLAAMIVAAERFVAQHPSHEGSIGLLITSDEEDIAINGTKRVIETLQARGETIDYCVVGEPSSSARLGDAIRVGRRGSLNGTLTLNGPLGHVAYPDATPNSLHEALRCLTPLTRRVWDEGNEYFRATSFQISNLNSGTGAVNVIPDKVRVAFNFRYSTEQTEATLKSAVEDAIAEIDSRVTSEIDWHTSGLPFLSQQGVLTDTVVSTIKEITGLDTEKSTAGGTSDARFIVPSGIETVEIGPVNATIHKINERIALSDLEPLAAVYQRIMEKVLIASKRTGTTT
ncbi:MAG: succinyl-diaminopimelate desuccinylase [Gammaproteobacteria bacterium]|nr:succinyl-diaminopimelate desuccinylase [Gammaproteobacteria bacterium]